MPTPADHTVHQLVDWLSGYGYVPSAAKIERMREIIDKREPENRGGHRASGRKGEGRAKTIAKRKTTLNAR